MDRNDPLVQTIKLLAEHEEAVGLLYLLYSDQFGDFSDFWAELSSDKRAHANWIKTIYGGIYAGDIILKPDRFSLNEISKAIDFIKKQIDSTHRIEVSLMQAFATAVGIEENSLEKNFFAVYDGDAPQLQHVLIDVRLSISEHCKKIRDQYDKIRPSLQWHSSSINSNY